MNAVSTPTVMRPRLTCQMPKAQTTSRPMSVSSDTVGENRLQVLFSLSLTARFRRFASRKRAASRRSCAKALTTRMPGMVSASTLVTSPHTRSIFSKPVRSRSRTMWIIQAMKGSGTSVTSASPGSIDSRIAAVMPIISRSVAKSSACSDRKTEMRSVSEPMRAIRSPVRLAPK
jgi:hypothetical protein